MTATPRAPLSPRAEHGLRLADAAPQRIPVFSPLLYRYRNLVGCFFNKLKHFRAIATRYDKRDGDFLSSVQLGSIRI